MRLRVAALGALFMACGAPSTTTSNVAALARGVAVDTLAAGKLDSLPTGPVYIRLIRFAQPVGYVINSKQHVASFVFVEIGAHRLVLAGQPPLDLSAGQATFHQSVTHQHLNPGPAPSVWYSIAIWPSSARGQPLVDPIAKAAYESPDVSRENLPQVAYSMVLRRVTLVPMGTSGSHRFGGLSAFYVLSGSLKITSAHRAAVTVGAGNGTMFMPEAAIQETNPGSTPVVYLEYVSTAIGKDFDTPLQQPPSP